MNVLLRTSHTSRLSSCFNGPSILFKPLQQANIMRQLTPSRSLHTNVLRQARPNSRRPLAIALGLGSLPFLAPGRPISNDSFGTADAAPFSSSAATGAKKDVPVTKGGRLNPAAVRQISFGGLLGLGLGVLFSALSRMLVLVIGLSVVVWQYAARKGYNIIPAERIQRYVKGIDVRSAINDNVAFKISFGLMFALTAFGEF